MVEAFALSLRVASLGFRVEEDLRTPWINQAMWRVLFFGAGLIP